MDKWLGREKGTNRCSQGRGAPFGCPWRRTPGAQPPCLAPDLLLAGTDPLPEPLPLPVQWCRTPKSKGSAYCRRPPNRDGPTELAPTEEVPELRNSSFSDFRQNRRKTNFLRRFLKNPSVESVAGEHTQLFTEGFPVIFHKGLFSSWKRLFSG